jgi:chromate transporter
VNVASLQLMAVVTIQLARAALVDILTLLIASVGPILLIRWRVNSTWLVAGAPLVGGITHWPR